MSIERSKEKDYKPLSSGPKPGGPVSRDLPMLRPPGSFTNEIAGSEAPDLINLHFQKTKIPRDDSPAKETVSADDPRRDDVAVAEAVTKPADSGKETKRAKAEEKDRELLSGDRWLVRNGHLVTYIGLYLFSILVLFRPYELVPALGFLSATAFYFGLATLLIYLPSQLATEGTLTMFSTEVKAILALTAIALLTIPIAKDPGTAWDKFTDPYIKAVVIFITMVNVLRTRQRLMGMIWLSLGIGVYLGFAALQLSWQGKFSVEGYRVAVNVGGMFGNANEMAMHFVMMTPLAITLGMASKNKAMRWVYLAMAGLFVGANMVTQSRGGFLGLLACLVVLAWKIGRKYRLNVAIVSVLLGGIAVLAAPGNYGLRMLSIFVPSLDPVGSSDQRSQLLQRSLLVTARNPWGIGIGNFPIVGMRNLQTHNAFTQVSSELGILGLAAYLIFIISPFRKLSAIERTLFDKDEHSWFYYVSIGLQASIIGYIVSSFFASVAYGWFIYYLIAYAVAFRRIYSVENGLNEEVKAAPLWNRGPAEVK